MKQRSVDWTKAGNLPADELDRVLAEDHDEVDDNPSATAEQLASAVPGKRRPGQRGPGKRPPKVQVTLRVEPAALEAWKASGEGWMGRAADVLAREAPKPER